MTPSTSIQRVLMCPPINFEVAYEINAFMEGNQGSVNLELAKRQWDELVQTVSDAGAEIEILASSPGLPDLVFTANGGLVWGNKVVLPRFAHPERQGEESLFRDWFEANGFEIFETPDGVYYEGEGDTVVRGDHVFLGCQSRTSALAASILERVTGLEVVPLALNPRALYHLDTCMFSAGPSAPLFFCPEAFEPEGADEIRKRSSGSGYVEVGLDAAMVFACNTVVIGQTAISPMVPGSFVQQVEASGLSSVRVDLSEFLKAGGASKCLTLHLN